MRDSDIAGFWVAKFEMSMETSSDRLSHYGAWPNSESLYTHVYYPFLIRGCGINNTTNNASIFSFNRWDGSPAATVYFRVTLSK